MAVEKSFLTYWKELVQRDDPYALRAEANTMSRMVGLKRIFELVIADQEAQQRGGGEAE